VTWLTKLFVGYARWRRGRSAVVAAERPGYCSCLQAGL
jgi:hypothetical protein